MRARLVRGVALCALTSAALLVGANLAAQSAAATRLAVLLAVERGATSLKDLGTLRTATRSGNSDIARLAYRSLGRLERPALIPDILPGLRHSLPEVRADAADALAQSLDSAPGSKEPATRTAASLATVQSALTSRLAIEADGDVRAVIRESLARLPFTRATDVAAVTRTVLDATRSDAQDRLGTARALEILIRVHGDLQPPATETIDVLRTLAAGPLASDTRDARVRRVAVDALIQAHGIDAPLAARLMQDSDAQVRQRAMRGAGAAHLDDEFVRRGLADPAPAVRLEALRAIAVANPAALCSTAQTAAHDPDLTTALAAIDLLATCGQVPDAVVYLESAVADRSEISVARAWHRGAHALVALATAAPDRVGERIADYARSSLWPVRRDVVRAAVLLGRSDLLERLAADPEPEVANAARVALGQPRLPDTTTRSAGTLRVSANDLQQLAAPRARITVRDVGRIEIALLTDQAPFTVLRFVELARAGYYDGTTFDTITPGTLAQLGERADQHAPYPRPEPGRWPHVRGTVALASTDSSDARFFINLADAPAFDHTYTLFAQVLNGSDVVDRILEGDIIDDIEILP